MTIAGEFAEFLARISPTELPPQTLDHAAMLIASTLASAALGAAVKVSALNPKKRRARLQNLPISRYRVTRPRPRCPGRSTAADWLISPSCRLL